MQTYVKNEKRYRFINCICLLAVYKKLIGTGRVLGTSTAVTARALTLGVKSDCKSMSVKLRYWIVNIIQRDTARPLVSRLFFERSFT